MSYPRRGLGATSDLAIPGDAPERWADYQRFALGYGQIADNAMGQPQGDLYAFRLAVRQGKFPETAAGMGDFLAWYRDPASASWRVPVDQALYQASAAFQDFLRAGGPFTQAHPEVLAPGAGWGVVIPLLGADWPVPWVLLPAALSYLAATPYRFAAPGPAPAAPVAPVHPTGKVALDFVLTDTQGWTDQTPGPPYYVLAYTMDDWMSDGSLKKYGWQHEAVYTTEADLRALYAEAIAKYGSTFRVRFWSQVPAGEQAEILAAVPVTYQSETLWPQNVPFSALPPGSTVALPPPGSGLPPTVKLPGTTAFVPVATLPASALVPLAERSDTPAPGAAPVLVVQTVHPTVPGGGTGGGGTVLVDGGGQIVNPDGTAPTPLTAGGISPLLLAGLAAIAFFVLPGTLVGRSRSRRR